MDRLHRDYRRVIRSCVSSSIRISVIPRKIAAADFNSNAMPLLEQHAGGPQLYPDGLGRRDCSVCLRIGTSQDAIGHVEHFAIGMHIHKLDREISIHYRCLHVQGGTHRSSDFCVGGKRFGRVDQYVRTALNFASLARR